MNTYEFTKPVSEYEPDLRMEDDGKLKGMATETHIRILDTEQWEKSVTFYDQKSRPVRAFKLNHLGGYTDTDSELNFRGLPVKVKTKHLRDQQGLTVNFIDRFNYDDQERLISQVRQINNDSPQLIASNTYDAIGQLINKKVGGSSPQTVNQERWQSIDYKYNIRGWLTDINHLHQLIQGVGMTPPAEHDVLFAFKITYDELYADNGFADPLYNGNISQTYWRTGSDNVIRGYDYTYDKLNRLRNAEFNNGSENPYSEAYKESIGYDINGNITALARHNGQADESAYKMDDLIYEYQNGNGNSNLLINVTDLVSNDNTDGFIDGNNDTNLNDYEYDANGNMTKDRNKGIEEITYNHLNLPIKIDWENGQYITYQYNAAGQKVNKTVYFPDGPAKPVDYLDGFQYAGNVLQFFPHPEGYVNVAAKVPYNGADPVGYFFNYVYNYTDHLGNIRMSYTLDPQTGKLNILDESHYYPFGLKHTVYVPEEKKRIMLEKVEGIDLRKLKIVQETDYQYKYNGKEWQDELGLNFYDYGARNYDQALGR